MTRRTLPLSWIASSLALLVAGPLAAQNGQVTQRVPCERLPGAACHELAIDLVMPSGRRATLSFFFERAINLTRDSFLVTAREVSTEDSTIASRLPPGVFINGAFPLLVTIEPNRALHSPVRFRGAWRLELETDALEFDGVATTKVYQAHDDHDTFADITKSVGFGSYRVSGDGGDFSQFLLVTDMRPPRQVALASYDRLGVDIDAGQAAGEINSTIASALRADLKASRDAFTAVPANRAGALTALQTLVQRVLDSSGNGIGQDWDRTSPGVSKPSRAGVLRGDAAALRLSIELAQRLTQSSAKGSLVRVLDTPARQPFQVTIEFPDEIDDIGGLNVTAQDVNRKDPLLLGRLPKNVTIPAAFPVLITVSPRSGRRPAFREAVSVEVVTDELALLNNSNLRLFKAENAQADFHDISTTFGVGSYRVSGDGGDFSQFLIVEDRRSFNDVLKDKFDRLEDQLDDLEPVITSPGLFSDLVELVELARSHADRRRQPQAIAALDQFIALVRSNGGVALPDIWRAGGPGGAGARNSGGGNLIAGARTLQLTLTLQKSSRKQLEP